MGATGGSGMREPLEGGDGVLAERDTHVGAVVPSPAADGTISKARALAYKLRSKYRAWPGMRDM